MKIYWYSLIDDYIFTSNNVRFISYDSADRTTLWLSPYFNKLHLEFICEVK